MMIAYIISILGMIVLPVALGAIVHRRWAAPWWLFCVGMVTFIGSQVGHLPFNEWLNGLGLFARGSPQEPASLMMAIVGGLSAGLWETAARVVGYWLLFRYKQARHWADAVMVGLGHGGIESMIFGAVLIAATVTSLLALQGVDLSSLNLSPEQLATIRQQIDLLMRAPWNAFAPLLERGTAIALHISLSVLVWSAFKQRNPLFVLAAILYHAAVDASAIYMRGRVDNVWLIEGIFALLVLPAAVWAWRLRSREAAEPAPRSTAVMPWRAEWRAFGAAVYKELFGQWRTSRILIVGAVFVLFGMGSPLLAHLTPQILKSIAGAEQFANLIPTPTTADALGQYVKNLTQFGFILAVLLGMGAVAGEKERGTAAVILSKPMPRWAFVLSKFTAQALIYLAAFLVAALGAAYYTSLLFEPLAFGPFMLGNLLLWVWLLTFAAFTLFASTVARTTGVAAGIGFGGSVALLLAGSLPRIGQLMPTALVAWAGQLGLQGNVSPNGGALAAGVVWIVVWLIAAVAALEVQEI